MVLMPTAPGVPGGPGKRPHLGAGGYLAKPFHFAELVLPIRWDEHAGPFINTVTMTISRLRRKLGGRPVITTIGGTGYRVAGPGAREQLASGNVPRAGTVGDRGLQRGGPAGRRRGGGLPAPGRGSNGGSHSWIIADIAGGGSWGHVAADAAARRPRCEETRAAAP